MAMKKQQNYANKVGKVLCIAIKEHVVNLKTTLLMCVVIALFCGCTPEETFVQVNASALKKATMGQLTYAKVEMVFDVNNDDDVQLPTKIRKAALPYLGKDAVIEVERTEKRKVREGGSIRENEEVEVDKSLAGAKLVGRFNIPVGTAQVLNSAPRSVLWLKYSPNDKTFRLVHGNAINGLNSALSDVDYSISFEYDGGAGMGLGGTTIKIVNDDAITIGVAAVKVNNKPMIAGSRSTGDSAIKIDYDNSFYQGVAPCFTFGGFQAMDSKPTKNMSTWNDE